MEYEKIKERRKYLKMTQRKLSVLSGVSISTIQRIESGNFSGVSFKYFLPLLNSLGLEMKINFKPKL